MDAERQRLINEAARILGNINQIYVDAAYWNEHTRARLCPDAKPIDPDPSGEMAAWKRNLEAMLRHEAALGNFPNPAEPPCPT
jgi:hypothetical protein